MSCLETAKVLFFPVTFLNLNFLTTSVLSLIRKLHLFALNLTHNLLLILTYHILLLAVSFVALSQYCRSLFANFCVIPPPNSCVLDPIPTTLLKKYLDDLVTLIYRIVNDSLLSGSVPRQLKEAVVILFLKKTRPWCKQSKKLQACVKPAISFHGAGEGCAASASWPSVG